MVRWTDSEMEIGERNVQRTGDVDKGQGYKINQELGLSTLKG
jgi:hypothetical protein